jgi:hypothetical protein
MDVVLSIHFFIELFQEKKQHDFDPNKDNKYVKKKEHRGMHLYSKF